MKIKQKKPLFQLKILTVQGKKFEKWGLTGNFTDFNLGLVGYLTCGYGGREVGLPTSSIAIEERA